MKKILNYINNQLKEIPINYAYLRWNKEIVYPYFVGECSEPTEPTEEDQYHEFTFILTGFTTGSSMELEEARAKIEKLFSTKRAIVDNSAVVISYAGAFPIPIEEGRLKKIQININIKEWRVN